MYYQFSEDDIGKTFINVLGQEFTYNGPMPNAKKDIVFLYTDDMTQEERETMDAARLAWYEEHNWFKDNSLSVEEMFFPVQIWNSFLEDASISNASEDVVSYAKDNATQYDIAENLVLPENTGGYVLLEPTNSVTNENLASEA